jgi:hypothetical protein
MAKQTFTTGQVLTAAQMTSLQQTAMLGGSASAKTASYTLVAADAGTAISMSNASATTITVNTALFAAGDTVQITNLGAGVCTITAGTATVNTSASLALAQYESGTLDFTSTSAAIFIKGAGATTGAGNMVQIATGTLSGANVTISSLSAYSELFLVIYSCTNATSDGEPYFRINNDNTATAYQWSGTVVVGGTPQINNNTGTDLQLLNTVNNVLRTSATQSYAVRFFNCKNAGYTTYDVVASAQTTASHNSNVIQGVFKVSATVSSLVIANYGGNWSAGTYTLWGA